MNGLSEMFLLITVSGLVVYVILHTYRHKYGDKK